MKNAQDSVQRGDGPREEEEERGSIASEDSSSSGSSSPDQDKALLLLNSFQEDSHVGKGTYVLITIKGEIMHTDCY